MSALIIGSILAMAGAQPVSASDEAMRAQALVARAAGAFVETNGRSVATAPRSAGYPGLCFATVADLQFSARATAPLTTRFVYRVVGDLAPRPNGWDDAYGAELELKCRNAGRVLNQNEYGLGTDQFFKVRSFGGEPPYPALLAIQRAVARAKAHPGDLTCGRGSQLNCAAEASKLDFDQLVAIDLKPCLHRERAYCAAASFSTAIRGNLQESVTVRFEMPLTPTGLSSDGENFEVEQATTIIR